MRKIIMFLLAALLLCSLSLPALAESYTGDPDWSVTFTADKEMVSNFRSSTLDEAVAGLQPGDDIVFTVHLANEYEERVNWYMLNSVLYSLEDRSANAATAGGGYSYELLYVDPSGKTNVLYSSDTVGGEEIGAAGEGLHEATNALAEFFYLDNLAPGQSGQIELSVALDGETQGNDYQDTLADLQMSFAVDLDTVNTPFDPEDPEDPYNPENPDSPYNPEDPNRPDEPENPEEPGEPNNPNPPYVVKTGDDLRLVQYCIALTVNGVLFLLLGIYCLRLRRKEKEAERS